MKIWDSVYISCTSMDKVLLYWGVQCNNVREFVVGRKCTSLRYYQTINRQNKKSFNIFFSIKPPIFSHSICFICYSDKKVLRPLSFFWHVKFFLKMKKIFWIVLNKFLRNLFYDWQDWHWLRQTNIVVFGGIPNKTC